jgi:hypothetical protein
MQPAAIAASFFILYQVLPQQAGKQAKLIARLT